MAEVRDTVAATIKDFLVRADKVTDFDDSTPLLADGLGLDSLEIAELSSMLEDELGKDPFSEGIMAETVGEIMSFYEQG